METITGPLLTPPAEAVTVAVPVKGLPAAFLPLQTTNVESHTPPQISPEGEMLTRLGLEELKVKVVFTGVLDEFAADTVSCATSPATMETDVGVRLTTATVFLLEEPPPQPAIASSASSASRFLWTNHCIHPRRLII